MSKEERRNELNDSSGSDKPQDCPMCGDNSGGYGQMYIDQSGQEQLEHMQCEWCWTNPNSKFNQNPRGEGFETLKPSTEGENLMNTKTENSTEGGPVSNSSSTDLLGVGTLVEVKAGASKWMKERGYWLRDWPDTIDGMRGRITHDYTEYRGDDSHYEVELDNIEGCGIHPQFLIT